MTIDSNIVEQEHTRMVESMQGRLGRWEQALDKLDHEYHSRDHTTEDENRRYQRIRNLWTGRIKGLRGSIESAPEDLEKALHTRCISNAIQTIRKEHPQIDWGWSSPDMEDRKSFFSIMGIENWWEREHNLEQIEEVRREIQFTFEECGLDGMEIRIVPQKSLVGLGYHPFDNWNEDEVWSVQQEEL